LSRRRASHSAFPRRAWEREASLTSFHERQEDSRMSPQKTHAHPAPMTALLHENPDALRMTARRLPPRRRGFWLLLLCIAALNVAVIARGVYLFVFAGKSVAPPPGRKIAVPFAAEAQLWDSLRGWVVQEDGRNKPFETFCREAVRTVTGRERFEGNDPIAV